MKHIDYNRVTLSKNGKVMKEEVGVRFGSEETKFSHSNLYKTVNRFFHLFLFPASFSSFTLSYQSSLALMTIHFKEAFPSTQVNLYRYHLFSFSASQPTGFEDRPPHML